VLKIHHAALICALIGGFNSSALAQQNSNNQPEPTYTLGSNDMDIIKLIQTVATATGKTIVIDPGVKGKVKIMTNDNAMTADELYETFRAVLQVSKFTVVEVGNVTRVIPIRDARSSPVSDALPSSGMHEVVTDVIPVENTSASKLLQVLRPMVSSNASIAPHDGSNTIIVTDTRANIERIRRVIKRLDLETVATTEVIQLKYASAEELVATLNKLESNEKRTEASNKLQIVADKRNNAILVVGEDLQRQRVKDLIARLDRPQQQTGNVRVVYLDYADAKKVAETLSKVAQNLGKLGPPGGDGKGTSVSNATVEADEDTNALLITAEGDALNSLLAVVERLDIRRAQVLVEAIIVQVNLNDDEELGVEWLFSNEDKGGFGGSSLGANGGTSLGVASGLLGDSSGVETLASNIAALPGQTFGIAGINGSENFLAILRALDSNSRANVLSTPSLVTMDNHEAEISVGKQVPFLTGSYSSTGNGGSNIGSPFSTIQREDVGISLKVTPQVNEGDKVLLEIEQEVSSLDAPVPGSADLVTNQSIINTQILASDGEIVVLGGLRQEDVTDSTAKVPVLGSIPILGNLFKYQQSTAIKTNLMVFLRVKIVRDDAVMNAATAEKYESMRLLQIKQREDGLPLMKDELIPILPPIASEDLELPEDK
jgi:general secretion pathway protein D